MQQKNKNSSSLGIFRRVFNFFLDNLLARGVKRVTLGQQHDALSHASSPVNAEMMVLHQDHENPNNDLGSEIQVHFKQYEELEPRTQVDKFANSSHAHMHSRDKAEAEREKKNVSKEPPARKNKELPLDVDHPQLQGRGGARLRGAKRTIGLKESTEEEQRKSIPNETLTLAIQEEEVKRTPRRFRPLLVNVPPNINEISDEFIKTRKEAMGRNLRMDSKASKPT
ncbi:hypothetical protein OWV82_000620 [Melia azedarach]|uniref:Uncharacterized protein n=1 Tax=Melia azedarach TaxID=155640 RepID=A0ACC1YWW3_MELAZ|nr:hypothetical protein OWV82_000620 [Melia azedarach]